MSGFGSWNPREWVRACPRIAAPGILSLFILASVTACGDSGSVPTPTSTVAPAPTTTPVTPSPTPDVTAEPSPALGLQTLPSIAELVERVQPAVASITVDYVARGLFFDFPEEGAGSGIVLSPDGFIVTNAHVIRAEGEIKVHLPNGDSYVADVVGIDGLSDLAVLKIDAENLPVAKFADSDALRVGDWVVTIGNALALKGGPTVTIGIVSGLGRTVTTEEGREFYGLIQTDAAINDGNSGGPLINLDGEVVGINHTILRQAQGMGFAISSSGALPLIQSLIDQGRVIRPLIGLNGVDVNVARANQLGLTVDEGIIVATMARNGPAYNAGIRVADVITKIDDIPTPDMASFLQLLWSYNVGDKIKVQYIHENQTKTTTVELVERPS